MSRFRIDFDRLGGPGAVTWWAFGISLLDRLITVSVQPVNAAAPASARIVATILAQLIMFAPLVLLRFTLLKDPLRPRPWVALAGFAFVDVLRGIAVDWLLHELGGLPLMPGLRVFSGFLPTIIPLLVTAYVVNTFRERSAQLAALQAVRGQLEHAKAEAESMVQSRNEDLVGRVRSVMESELAALSTEQPAGVVARLQRTASEVVRPLSHELASSFAVREGASPPDRPIRASWREVLGTPALDRPLNPSASTLLLSGVWIPAAVTFAPVRWTFVVTLPLIALCLTALNPALGRVLPRLRPLARVALVLGTCLAVGVAIGVIVRVTAGDWSSATSLSIAAGFYVAGVSAGMALVNGALGARAAVLSETASVVEELRRQVLRTRQLTWFHQRGLARALHGPVQSAVTAAALRLDEASRRDAIAPELVESVREDLMRTLDVLADPDPSITSIDAGLARIVGTWDGVCAVASSVDDGAHDVLTKDAVTRASVLDIVTDATSNAVRHGHATNVSIALTCESTTIVLDVHDDGSAPIQATRSGLGTTLLDDCALAWSLTQNGVGHRLHVVLSKP